MLDENALIWAVTIDATLIVCVPLTVEFPNIPVLDVIATIVALAAVKVFALKVVIFPTVPETVPATVKLAVTFRLDVMERFAELATLPPRNAVVMANVLELRIPVKEALPLVTAPLVEASVVTTMVERSYMISFVLVIQEENVSEFIKTFAPAYEDFAIYRLFSN